jgi:hypothetical protein
MGVACREIQEWIEEQVEKPIEDWENQQQQRCRDEDCNWWTLCLNKVFCWFVWVLVKVVRWIVVTVGKWVVRVVCEVITFLLDILAGIVNLILSIPIIGGIIRTVWNWLTEIFWRLVGLLDFGLSLLGVRWEKRIYVGVVIPLRDGVPITTEAQILPQIDKAKDLYKKLCNIKLVYTGACNAPFDAPEGALTVGCDAGGFFSDWWVGGSYIELASESCKFEDGWRRVLGYGAQIIVFYVSNVTPDSPPTFTVGCSFASTHNYVVVEPTAGPAVAAHEIGHACWLSHVPEDPTNLMFPSNLAADPILTSWQVSVVRWSKHCVYF